MHYRLKYSFTAGELSPTAECRVDFDRHQNGCKKLYNAICLAQGPCINRTGSRFIYDITSLNLDIANPEIRMIEFIFNRAQSYNLIFYKDTAGHKHVVFGTNTGLVVISDPPITECPAGTPATYTAGDIVSVTLPDTWDIQNFDFVQSADEIYCAQPGLAPHIIKRHSHECWELENAYTSMTSPPANWSDDYGWPERVTFHQQRLVFAANTLRPNTVWMSRAGDFAHFGKLNTELVDADAVTFTLNSGTQNRIQWLVSSKYLEIGTLGDEWTVTGSDQKSITPSNVTAERHTFCGSEPVGPVLVNHATLFLERLGKRINEFVYDYSMDSYKSVDLSIVASHMTEQDSIHDWAFQPNPDNIVWSVRDDGALLGLTYQRDHKVVGWHEHQTDGTYQQVSCIPGDSREDDVYVIVRRVINGAVKYYYEVFEPRFIAHNAEWARYLDSFLVYQGAATSTVHNLSHLEGKTVGILADGLVQPTQVVTTGTITLAKTYSHIVVGLPYESIIWPLYPDRETAAEGTALGRKTSTPSLKANFYKTLGCTIGRYNVESDAYTEFDIPFRNVADGYSDQIALFSGWKNLGSILGDDTDFNFYIKQTLPLPMMVRAIVDGGEVHE